MGIKERRARNEDKVSLVRGGGVRGRGGRGGGRGRGSSSRGRGNGRDGQSDRGQEGGRGGRGRGGRGRGGRGRGNFQPKRELDEPEVKEEPEEVQEERKMPQWKLKKMAEEEERKKPVIEKSFRVILEGLKTELKTFQEIKTLTDGEKITPNKTFLEENVILEYRQKKHALKACHVLCGFKYKDCKLHAALETKNDLKAHRRTRIIIRNLPWSCDEDSLKTLMREYGHVTEVKIPKKDDGKMRGFGFVQFTHGHESAKAISNVKEIDGRKVACDWSLPREVYQEIKDKEEPAEEVEEEEDDDEAEESENENEEGSENEEETDEMEVDGSDVGELSEDDSEGEGDLSEESENEEQEEVVKNQKKEKAPKKTAVKDSTGADVYEGRSVFLRNIPFDATEEDLQEICTPFGEVKKVNIVRNGAGVSKGLAFIEYSSKLEADNCVLNSKELSLNDRPIFARISLPQTEINKMKKDKEEEMKAKPDRRNLTLSREGEIRAGSSAAKDMSEEDQKRRENFAKLKLDKLKNLDNFIDPCKLMIHNIPKAFTEDEMKRICQKAANGNVYNDVKKNKIKIKTFHLMKDKEDKSKSLGYAFCTFENHDTALKCLRVLNNHPSIFSKEKRPIVEFAVENAKAVKLLADRRERTLKKKELQSSITGEDDGNAVVEKKKKKLRPWQEAMLERKRKKRMAQRPDENVKMEVDGEEPRVPPTQNTKPPTQTAVKSGPPKAKKVKKNEEGKADYAGLEVKKGSTGRLQKPRHTGAKIRARDKGKLVREQQITKIAKRKKRLAALGVTAVKKKIKNNNEGTIKQVKRKETDSGEFDKMVAAYKSKISAKL